MKQQKIKKSSSKPVAKIIDNRKPDLPESDDYTNINKPVRTVLYVEVKDMDQKQVQLMVQYINEMYKGSRGGIHYVIPIRHGKISSDIVFEEEFLKVVREVCESDKDGQIVLKNGATDVHVIRQMV